MSPTDKEKRKKCEKPLHIVFLHLDLGIGGAEQLVINLALASLPHLKNKSLDARVSIFTTHCDQGHCFDAVRKNPEGRLSKSVHLVGTSLPVSIFGKGTAFCSTIRMLYLSHAAMRMYPDADVFVLDVLPTPIPFLVQGSNAAKSVIYYCHFPDKLLTRDTVNGEKTGSLGQSSGRGVKTLLKDCYRDLLDRVEEWSMSFADVVCVNSIFTMTEVMRAFPTLKGTEDAMQVLYPAIDLNKFVPPDFKEKEKIMKAGNVGGDDNNLGAPIVSLNRFERKKNIEILLHAYAALSKKESNKTTTLPVLVISGGYDPRNTENVEYLIELKELAKSLDIEDRTRFLPSVSDEKRASLLKSATCVVYTPHREHFGIVPLEAMYAGSAVIAMNSGGPKETVVDGVTGILVDLKPGDDCTKLADAIQELLSDSQKAINMGKKGHEHVKQKFGMVPFQRQWKNIVQDQAIPRGLKRKQGPRGFISPMHILMLITIIVWNIAKVYL